MTEERPLVFGEAGPGDFIEAAPDVWKEIRYITWHKAKDEWSVTTTDGTHYEAPHTFRYKNNPDKPEGPMFV